MLRAFGAAQEEGIWGDGTSLREAAKIVQDAYMDMECGTNGGSIFMEYTFWWGVPSFEWGVPSFERRFRMVIALSMQRATLMSIARRASSRRA